MPVNRLFAVISSCAFLVCSAPCRASDDAEELASAKEALQALNDYIGDWKGTGDVERAKPGSKNFWSENVSWTWRFKKDDAWLAMAIKNGKLFKSGELRYSMDAKKYQFTAVDPKDKKLVFEGVLKNGLLVLERTDEDKKETQQISMNVAGDGVRFNYWYKTKPLSKKIYSAGYLVACNKEGEALGGKSKGKECVVSGGLGKIEVSFKGETFYVCCTGCRDAFNENPEKYVKEFKAKQK
jgi:hypothetical protein